MIRALSRKLWHLTMRIRFKRAPVNPRASDGRFISRRDWRLNRMREGIGG